MTFKKIMRYIAIAIIIITALLLLALRNVPYNTAKTIEPIFLGFLCLSVFSLLWGVISLAKKLQFRWKKSLITIMTCSLLYAFFVYNFAIYHIFECCRDFFYTTSCISFLIFASTVVLVIAMLLWRLPAVRAAMRGRRGLISFATVLWIVFWAMLASNSSSRTYACAAIAVTSGCCLLLYWSDCIYITSEMRNLWIRASSFLLGAAMIAAGILTWCLQGVKGRNAGNGRFVAMMLLICGLGGMLTYAPVLGDDFGGRGSFCSFWDKAFSDKNCFKTIVVIAIFVLLILLLVVDVKYGYYRRDRAFNV